MNRRKIVFPSAFQMNINDNIWIFFTWLFSNIYWPFIWIIFWYLWDNFTMSSYQTCHLSGWCSGLCGFYKFPDNRCSSSSDNFVQVKMSANLKSRVHLSTTRRGEHGSLVVRISILQRECRVRIRPHERRHPFSVCNPEGFSPIAFFNGIITCLILTFDFGESLHNRECPYSPAR